MIIIELVTMYPLRASSQPRTAAFILRDSTKIAEEFHASLPAALHFAGVALRNPRS